MRSRKRTLLLQIIVILSLTCIVGGCQTNLNLSSVAQIKPENIVLEEIRIPSTDGNYKIYLRHKKLARQETPKADEVVLFLEPFSIPTAKAFDVPGYSWMNDFAKKGYDTWAMDFRGFGQSDRPKEMNAPPGQNPPVVTHREALKDLAAAVETIKKNRNVDRINLVGWSWGAVVAGEYAALQPENVNKLVLYGFMHGFRLPSMTEPFESKQNPGKFNPQAPAYQVVDFETGMHHWHMMMNGRPLASSEAMEKVENVFAESDPTGKNGASRMIRRPMGPLKDLYSIWTNRPLYDLSKITSPVLVIYGDSDFFAEKKVLRKLTGTKEKKEVVIPEATHWVLYEKNRDILLENTDRFLRQH
ncbi:alpha/beta hydrolase [Thermoactinomyces mirandus]|uniref:Alpha/beta hydrolase n=1 Tax=Thermoactinomyces mirandus TaxID=2756294 RepID=A0A7W2AR24_9BACL|nr:alpha/beta hydrolase [Thermoactinomyces mirandus]MBA4602123.1 alpha/beta hydrolase [Thermoactinomyces mirandus]